MLTKIDIAALRKGDDICVYLSKDNPNGLVRLIKRNRPNETDPFAQDIEHKLTAKVELHGFHGRKELSEGAVKCFAMCGLHHWQHSHASCVLKTLREGDEITFVFWPDAHSNGYVAAQHLHADLLQLRVRRNGKTIAEWELTTSTTPENSARMCRGVPVTDSYRNAADEARKVA